MFSIKKIMINIGLDKTDFLSTELWILTYVLAAQKNQLI